MLRNNPDENSYIMKILLIGNKLDLSEGREVSYEEGNNKCKELKLDGFLEVSAKSGEGLTELFQKITELLYNDIFEDSKINIKEKQKLKNLTYEEEGNNTNSAPQKKCLACCN